MYGYSVDSLNMYVKTGLTLPTTTWTLKGSQGRDWHLASVDITTSRVFNVSRILNESQIDFYAFEFLYFFLDMFIL